MTQREELARLRREYGASALDESHVGDEPIAEVRRWLEQAISAELREPHAMTLATVDAVGQPHARVVLLKELSARGLTFATNYDSHKGRELAENPRAALCFFWAELERQVRVEGTIARLPPAESEAYFGSRPREAQLGAHASLQSQPLADRAALERRFAEVTRDFDGRDVPRPPHWGGYLLTPLCVELWQGRASRLHDRLVWQRSAPDAPWTRHRLNP